MDPANQRDAEVEGDVSASTKGSDGAEAGAGVDKGSSDRSDRLIKKAWALMDAGQVEEARGAFEQAAASSRAPARVWVEVGVASYQREDLEAAERAFERATVADPGFLTAWNNLGRVRFAAGRHKEAIACYKEVLARDGDNYRAWLNSGLVMADLARWEQAVSCYDEALKAQREDPEALYRKGLALAGSGDRAGGLDRVQVRAGLSAGLLRLPDGLRAGPQGAGRPQGRLGPAGGGLRGRAQGDGPAAAARRAAPGGGASDGGARRV